MKTIVWMLATLAATAAFAGEGMWTPQQIPQLAPELRSMGIKIDPNRFADLTADPMGAVISLGGCTASFVSPDGLIVTNHHCGFGAIQYNSTATRDLITNGFLAKTREEERPTASATSAATSTTSNGRATPATSRSCGPIRTGNRTSPRTGSRSRPTA
ncbi:MAG: S46 family peptidase [Acidobacteriota bacterium]